MPRFAANLSMMFNEVPFLDRFARARAAGFQAVEFLFPYEFPAAEIALRLKDNGLQQVLFNAPPGDWAKGERGQAALPGRSAERKGRSTSRQPKPSASAASRPRSRTGLPLSGCIIPLRFGLPRRARARCAVSSGGARRIRGSSQPDAAPLASAAQLGGVHAPCRASPPTCP